METYGLSLKEILYLLSVKEKDGRSNVDHMNFGLIGACLFELVDFERIAIKDNRLKVNNHKPVGDPALDFVLEKLSHARKKKVKTLIKEGAISSSVSQSIQEMQAAIMAAVVASTAASTAAAGSN